MRIGVVADFMTFRIFLAEKLWPPVGIPPDDEEGRRHIFLFENVQNLGSPSRIRAIVESKRELPVGGADLVDMVRQRIGVVFFGGNEVRRGIISKGTVTALRSIEEVPYISIPFQDQVRPWR